MQLPLLAISAPPPGARTTASPRAPPNPVYQDESSGNDSNWTSNALNFMNGAFRGTSAKKYPTLQLTITGTKFSYGQTPYFVKLVRKKKKEIQGELQFLVGTNILHAIPVTTLADKTTEILLFVNYLKTRFNEILGSEEPQVEWPLEFKGTNGFDPSEEERSLKEKTLHHLRLAYEETLATPGRR